jgi:hypothetical protein
MKLTLVLDPTPIGVHASLVEEWEEPGRTAKMDPRVRLFETEEQTILWGRSLASRRGLKQIYLIDHRTPPRATEAVPESGQRGGGGTGVPG